MIRSLGGAYDISSRILNSMIAMNGRTREALRGGVKVAASAALALVLLGAASVPQ